MFYQDELLYVMYVAHYAPKVSRQNMLVEHFVHRAAKDLTYIEDSVFTEVVTPENKRTFELGLEKRNIVPTFVILWLLHWDHLSQQHQNNVTFYRPTASNAQCI